MDITQFVFGNREHALALGDYASYRSQLSRQVVALRRKLKITTPKNHKYTKRAPLTAEQINKDRQYVHLQLLSAERAWADAMAVKAAHAQDNASEVITGSTRKFIISRLHKAVGYASVLVDILSEKASVGATNRDFLDAVAYSRCLHGSEVFEKQFGKRFDDTQSQKIAWKTCLSLFSEAHVIYSALLHSSSADVYKEVIAGTVDPSIHYVAYQSRIPRTVAIATIAKRNFRQDQKALLGDVTALDPAALSEDHASVATSKDGSAVTDIPTTITWRGRKVPIADAAIGQSLAATTVAASHLASQLTTLSSPKAFAAAYDPVLTAAQDAVDAVRHALSDLAKEGIPESNSRTQDLRVTDLATNYALIAWRIGRNRVLTASSPASLDDGLIFAPPVNMSKRKSTDVGNSSSTAASKSSSRSQRLAALRDRSVLISSTVQSLDAIAALPGASRDAAFIAELDAQRAYFKALRCLNIGYAHAALGRSAEREALAMYARAANLAMTEAADAATSNISATVSTLDTSTGASGPPTIFIQPEQVSQLQKHATALANRQHGLVALHLLTESASPENKAATGPPLIHHGLDTFPSENVDLLNLVPYPPRLLPVPVKPIFLDLAWNYVAYPGQGGNFGAGAARVVQATANAVGVAQSSGNGDEDWNDTASQQNGGQRKKGWFGFGR